MANFDVAFNWMMDNEDQPRSYALVPDPVPVRPSDSADVAAAKRAAYAVSGINSFWHTNQYMAISRLPQEQRGPAVESAYQTDFWNQWMAGCDSDEVVKRVLDCEVNNGPGTGVKLLQESINAITGIDMTVDGAWGPNTMAATNNCNEAMLVSQFKRQRAALYQGIYKEDPSVPIKAWLARAAK